MTFSQKAAKYHGVSVGVVIIQRGYIRMRIDPDDSNVLVFPVQVIEEGKRHHTVAADGHDSVGVFCRKLPLRILNPRQDFVLGIDANCLPFLMSKFWDAFHNAEWDPWTVGSRGGPLWKAYEHGGPVLGTFFDLYRATVKRCNLPNKR